MSPLPFPLPSEDRATSPHTGWTRAHWEATADGLLDAAWKWSTPAGPSSTCRAVPRVPG